MTSSRSNGSDDVADALTEEREPASILPRAAPGRYVIVVAPALRGKFEARGTGGRRLCLSSQPFLDGARVLIEQGHPADTQLVMRHPGSPGAALSAPLAIASQLDTAETAYGPKFVRHRSSMERPADRIGSTLGASTHTGGTQHDG